MSRSRGGAASGFGRGGSDWIALGAVLLLIAALGALFGAREEETEEEVNGDPPLTVLIVDSSASVTRARPGWRRWIIRATGAEASAAAARGDEVALITFSTSAERRFGPGGADEFVAALRRDAATWFRGRQGAATGGLSKDLGSDLHGAALVAQALVRSSVSAGRMPGSSVVVFGDGVPTGMDPTGPLLDASGGRLRLVKPKAPSRVDLGLVRALSPEIVQPRVAVPVELDCVLTGPNLDASGSEPAIDVTWSLSCTSTESITRARNQGTTLGGTERLSIPRDAWLAPDGGPDGAADGQRRFRVRLALPGRPSGTARLTVTATLAGVVRDPFPENGKATTSWRVGDPVRVVVAAPPSIQKEVIGAFVGPPFEGIELKAVPVEALKGLLNAPGPELPDAVMTVECPALSLPAAELRAFVEERGGGWIHSAGWSLLRSDGGALSDLAALEPDREPRPARDIVFFVDGSGSMGSGPWRAMLSAMRQLVPSVPPHDALSLRFFTQVMGPEELRFEPLKEGASEDESKARADAIERLLRTRVPGGATDVFGSVIQLAESRIGRPLADGMAMVDGVPSVNDGLIILVSDGRTESVPALAKVARTKMRASRDDLFAIQVGSKNPAGFLKALLPNDRSSARAGEYEDLLDILQEAVHSVTPLRDATVAAMERSQADVERLGSLAREVVSATERAASLDVPLQIQRAVPCRLTPGSNAVLQLVSESIQLSGRTPILFGIAERGRGLVGTVAAPLVAEEAVAVWAPRLRGRAGLFAPLLRAAAAARDVADRENPAVRMERPPVARIEVDARGLLGAGAAARSLLVVSDLPTDVPLDVRAIVRRTRVVDASGRLTEGDAIASVELTPPSYASDPRTVRFGERPIELDGLERGEPLIVELLSGERPLGIEMDFVADGAMEIPKAGDRSASEPLAIFAHAATKADARRIAAASEAGLEGPRRAPGVVPWLLVAGLLGVFIGAAGLMFRR